MRVLLLGGNGFIGSRVADDLVAAGHTVAVVHRGRTPVPANRLSILVDRADSQALSDAIARFVPDTLVDMSAYTAAHADQLLAALPPGVSCLVLISSGDVYATYGAFLGQDQPPPDLGPVPETGPLRAHRYPYRALANSRTDVRHDYDKILVEERLRAGTTLPLTVLRLPMVYGPGDPQGRVPTDIRRLRDSPGTLTLHPDEAAWQCTRGYVADVASAIALAATHPRAVGRLYNVGELEAWSQQTWLAAIARELGWMGTIRTDPGVAPSMPGRWTVPLIVATHRIRQELGYREPVGRMEGLHRTVRAAAA